MPTRNGIKDTGVPEGRVAEIAMGFMASDKGEGYIRFTGTSNVLTDAVYAREVAFASGAKVQVTAGVSFNADLIYGEDSANPGVIEYVANSGAASGTAGAANAAGPICGVNIAGGAGGTTAGTVGNNGSNGLSPYGKTGALTDEYKGGAGGLGSSGAGGGGGTSTGISPLVREYGRGGAKQSLGSLHGVAAFTTHVGSGAGGGGGGGDGTAGGGGGAGGGYVQVMAGHIENMILRAKGGDGGSPAAGNRGGGGGGGGGRIRGIFATTTNLQYDVSGGTGGTKTGTGVDGSDGSCGVVEHSSFRDIGRSRITLVGDSITDFGYRRSSHFKLAGPRLVRNIAHTGDTLVVQLTAWQSAEISGRGQKLVDLNAVLVHCGTNDLRALANATTCQTRLTSLLTDVATNNPGIPIGVCRVAPAKSHYDAINVSIYPQWQAFNAIIDALEGTFVLTSKIYVSSETDTLLNNGSGSLNTADDIGDGLHLSRAGDVKLCTAYHNLLVRMGV